MKPTSGYKIWLCILIWGLKYMVTKTLPVWCIINIHLWDKTQQHSIIHLFYAPKNTLTQNISTEQAITFITVPSNCPPAFLYLSDLLCLANKSDLTWLTWGFPRWPKTMPLTKLQPAGHASFNVCTDWLITPDLVNFMPGQRCHSAADRIYIMYKDDEW